MSDASPNGLNISAKPSVAKMGRWPLYVVLLALLILGGVLVYSVNFAHDPTEEEGGKSAEIKEEDKPLWLVDGSGLALDPKKGSSFIFFWPSLDTRIKIKSMSYWQFLVQLCPDLFKTSKVACR